MEGADQAGGRLEERRYSGRDAIMQTSVPALVGLAILVVHLAAVPAAPQSAARQSVIVKFSTDGFWLNLHHFLYVLGRAEARMPDIQRAAVAGAPADQAKGLATLSADEQAAWNDAVRVYAGGLSRLDAVFDRQLILLTGTLARLGDSASLDSASPTLPVEVVATLTRAAPIYRKAWWRAHQRANRQWVATVQPLVDLHGPAVLAFITRVYQLPWPAGGYPVHVTAYTNWAGAYSTAGSLLVISSLTEGNAGVAGLEIVFHESMHQWDDPILAKLEGIGRTLGKRVPAGLTHAMIWMTAGEAIRRVVPGHVPIAESGGMWQRQPNAALRPGLESAWRPYLQGAGTRDDALIALMKLTPILQRGTSR
jgi:hypothetical protein